MSELRDRFTEALRPLAEMVSELDAEIARLERELSELRELRRNVKTVVGKLDPPKPRPRPRQSIDLDKKNRVLGHILNYPTSADITAPGLKDNGLGDPPISLGMLYGILQELRDDGYLRQDRVGKGGQAIYRRVSV